MGFFSNINEGATIYSGSDFDSLLSNNSVIPSDEYLELDEASLIAVAESEENYNSLVKYIGVTEASYFAQTGKEIVYTEGTLGNIFSKIKEFLKKVWEKIKAVFKRFIMLFDKYSKDDKSFVKKYEKAVRRASGEDIEFNGYPFSEAKLTGIELSAFESNKDYEDLKGAISGGSTAEKALKAKAIIDKINEDPEEIFDKIRGYAIKSNSPVSASDFSKELFEATHGSSSKESLDNKDKSAEEALRIISDTKETTKKAKKEYEKIDKLINKTWIKSVENIEKNTMNGYDSEVAADFKTSQKDKFTDVTSGTKTITADDQKNAVLRGTSALLNILHTMSGILTQVNGALLTAYKDRNRQARAICAKYIVKGKTQGAIGESASYNGSFLSDIQFK